MSPRRFVLIAALALGACGGRVGDGYSAGPREIIVGATCAEGDVLLEVEQGAGVSQSCAYWLHELIVRKAVYEAQWGRVDLAAWTVRLVRVADSTSPSQTGTWITYGLTWWAPRVVDLVNVRAFIHELHHVNLGPSSVGHAGWCPGFTDWEDSTGLGNNDHYLCP